MTPERTQGLHLKAFFLCLKKGRKKGTMREMHMKKITVRDKMPQYQIRFAAACYGAGSLV